MAEHHFRKALPRRSMMVDAGKPQVLDELPVHLVGRPPLRLCGVEPAVAHRVKERAEGDKVANRRIFLISQGLVFDSTSSRSIELRIVPRLGASRL